MKFDKMAAKSKMALKTYVFVFVLSKLPKSFFSKNGHLTFEMTFCQKPFRSNDHFSRFLSVK
jgi:hypothetical protein